MKKLTDKWGEVPLPDAEKATPAPKAEGKHGESPLGIYYDGRNGKYYRKAENGDFIVQNSQAIRRFLKSKGYSTKPPKDSDISPNEDIMEAVERLHAVDHVGAIAGKRAGFVVAGNTRILVTKSPHLIQPKAGEWPNLQTFLETLLPEEQSEWLKGWLAWSVRALYEYRYRPGQAVVIAGPRGCGKTLLAQLVTEMLGGRTANPAAYLAGETDFNGELAEAEHLLIDDEANDSAPKTKKRLGAKLRGIVANRSQRIHPKGRAALNLRPFWRISILLNDDPSSLSVLPQMEESLGDKITLLRASRATLPGESNDPDREEKLWQCLTGELPAFVHYLLHEHEIKEGWQNSRFGLIAFHEPSVLELLEPPAELDLLAMIESNWTALLRSQVDDCDPSPPDYEGTARDIETVLTREAPTLAKRVFYGSNVCGLLMGKLRDKHPARFSNRMLNGYNRWKIKPEEN